MKSPEDLSRDIDEIRSIMERSTKFPSLAGWAGIMAGVYALVGAAVAHLQLGFRPVSGFGPESPVTDLSALGLLAVAVLLLAVATAFILTRRKAQQQGGSMWTPASRQLLTHMALPLVTGGMLILILLSYGLVGLAVPLTLIFYGLALFSAGRYTVREVRLLGIIQILLGLAAAILLSYALLFWSIGFGVAHIIYGALMYHRYER